MKKDTKIKLFFFILLIFVFFSENDVLAIEPLKEEVPPNLPAGAKGEEKEVIEKAKEVVKKETKLTIERIHPSEAKIGEKIEITLKISNLGKEKVEFFVTETHKPGLEYPDPIEIKKFKYQALEVPYYGWKLTLENGKETEIKYHIISKNIGMILFSPAIINDEFGNNFESVPTTLKIACNPNQKCDSGENYIFCPEDCKTGSADGVCDGAKDGKCDPDCQKDADLDCQKIKELPNYYILVGIPFIIIILVAILISRFLKKRKINFH